MGIQDAGGSVDAGGEDAGGMDAGEDDAGTDAGAPDPVYAACLSTFGPDGSTGFVTLLDTIDSGTVDASEALEFPGRFGCVASEELPGALFVSDGESATITRFDLVEDALAEGETISFAGLGLSSAPNAFIIDATKGYVLDGVGRRIIRWDPTAMVIEGEFDLDGIPEVEGLTSRINGQFLGQSRLLLAVRYLTAASVDARRQAIIFVDTATDAVSVDSTDRCGAVAGIVENAAGDAYFASNNFSAASHRLGLEGSFAPCLFRALAGENVLDDDYDQALNELAGGAPSGGLYNAGGNVGFFQAYDESVTPIDPEAGPGAIQFTAAWRLWRLPELGGSAPATVVEDFPLSSGGIGVTALDGFTYFTRFTDDFTGGSLVRVDSDGNVTPALDSPTLLPLRVVRLR